MAVSLVIPASRACVSAAGPTTLGCKESHVAASLSPAGLEWELMSSSLAIPPSGHCPSLPSVSCPPTCEGVPFSRDAPLPTCSFSSLTFLQFCLWGEALVCPGLCLLGQMAPCGGQPLSTQNGAQRHRAGQPPFVG